MKSNVCKKIKAVLNLKYVHTRGRLVYTISRNSIKLNKKYILQIYILQEIAIYFVGKNIFPTKKKNFQARTLTHILVAAS